MERKELQEQRIRGYFIEATREILKGEGLRSINVRAVSERAGYSYATLYNYFKDIKELVFICVKEFQDECETLVKNAVENAPRGKERIKAIAKAYANYFVQYPGIFELFFLEKMNSLSGKQPTSGLIFTFLDRLCEEDWNFCIGQNICSDEEAEVRKAVINNLVTGQLLFYMNRMHPETYSEFITGINKQLSLLLD
jgi:AcrR family transcriptional regulator